MRRRPTLKGVNTLSERFAPHYSVEYLRRTQPTATTQCSLVEPNGETLEAMYSLCTPSGSTPTTRTTTGRDHGSPTFQPRQTPEFPVKPNCPNDGPWATSDG